MGGGSGPAGANDSGLAKHVDIFFSFFIFIFIFTETTCHLTKSQRLLEVGDDDNPACAEIFSRFVVELGLLSSKILF